MIILADVEKGGRPEELAVSVDFANRLPEAVVEDYFERRIESYTRRMGADSVYGGKDEFDAASHIVIATEAGRCVGGFRVTVREAGHRTPLPMEKDCPGLDLATLFPELPLASSACGEFSRMVIGSFERPFSFTNTIAERLCGYLWGAHRPRPDVPFVFSLSNLPRQRLYRALARVNGVDCFERPLPDHLQPDLLKPYGRFSVQAYLVNGRDEGGAG